MLRNLIEEKWTIADRDLRVTAAYTFDGPIDSICPPREITNELTSDYLPDLVPLIGREEAEEICKKIASRMVLPSGCKSFRKIIPENAECGDRKVLIISAETNKNGEVERVICRFWHYECDKEPDPELEDLYKDMVTNCTETISLLNARGFYTYVSPAISSMGDVSPEYFYGRHFAEVIHADDLEKCFRAMSVVDIASQDATEFSYKHSFPGSSDVFMMSSGRAFVHGDKVRYLTVEKNVSELVTLREELLARNKALSVLSSLAIAVSGYHDLSKALASALEQILGFLGFSAGSIVLRDPDGQYLQVVSSIVHVKDQELLASIWETFESVSSANTEVIVLKNVHEDKRVPKGLREIFTEHDVKHTAIVPFRCAGPTQAFMGIKLADNGDLTREQIEFLGLAASILGPAIDNAQLRRRERKRAKELEALAREANHRIKNSLQMVSGLLAIANQASNGGEEHAISKCLCQIQAISRVHNLLSGERISGSVGLLECIKTVASYALEASGKSDKITLHVSGCDFDITADSANALGIIINELVTNSALHGFTGKSWGRINIETSHNDGHTHVIFADNGKGLPPDFRMPETNSKGLGLISSMAHIGLHGDLDIKSNKDGTVAVLSFAAQKEKQ